MYVLIFWFSKKERKISPVEVSNSHWRPTSESSCEVWNNSVAYHRQQSWCTWTKPVNHQPSRRTDDSESRVRQCNVFTQILFRINIFLCNSEYCPSFCSLWVQITPNLSYLNLPSFTFSRFTPLAQARSQVVKRFNKILHKISKFLLNENQNMKIF